MAERPITVTVYASQTDNEPASASMTWQELAESLSDFRETDCHPCPEQSGDKCPAKNGEAWSPVLLLPPDRAPAKGPAGEVLRRNVNVDRITALVFDLDGIDDAAVRKVGDRIDGYRFIAHSTHSHRPPDDHRLRIVMALSRDVKASEWPQFFAAAVEHFEMPCDRKCKDLVRLFFLPSVVRGFDKLFEQSDGKLVDVDAILASARPLVTAIPKPTETSPQPPPEQVKDEPGEATDYGKIVAAVRDLRNTYSRQKNIESRDALDRVLNGKPLAQPGYLKESERDPDLPIGRDPAIHQVMCMIACKVPSETPPALAVEVVRRSIGSMIVEPEGLDHWLAEAEDCYRRAMARRVENDRRTAELNARIRAGIKTASLRKPGLSGGTRPSESSGPSGEGGAEASIDNSASEAIDAGSEDEGDWRDALRFKPVKHPDEDPQLVQCAHNAEAILTYAPEWRGVIRFNEVTKTVETEGAPLEAAVCAPSVFSTAVANYLQFHYELYLNEPQVRGVIAAVSRKNAFDPVRDYLESLVWDGKTRADDFLIDYCQAETANSVGDDITAHVRRVSARWLISAAARALDPGCQVDTVLVLEGKQGIKKSSLFRVLGGEWFADSQISLADKDSRMLASCSWIIELAEMSALSKSETESQKAFFTSQRDKFRPPYGAAIEDFPRRCVFVGTTNVDDYLQDHTGNRRFWPVRVRAIDLSRVKHERDQLWAEAVVRAKRAIEALRRGETPDECDKWWFDADSEEARVAEAQAEERTSMPTGIAETISAYFYDKQPAQRPAEWTTQEIARDVFSISADDVDRKLQTDIGYALKKLGFDKGRKRVPNSDLRVYFYAPSKAMLEAPRQPRGGGAKPVLSLIAGAKVSKP